MMPTAWGGQAQPQAAAAVAPGSALAWMFNPYHSSALRFALLTCSRQATGCYGLSARGCRSALLAPRSCPRDMRDTCLRVRVSWPPASWPGIPSPAGRSSQTSRRFQTGRACVVKGTQHIGHLLPAPACCSCAERGSSAAPCEPCTARGTAVVVKQKPSPASPQLDERRARAHGSKVDCACKLCRSGTRSRAAVSMPRQGG